VFSYDYSRSTVWIDDPHDLPGDQWVLCETHADRLTVPRGWSRLDRRSDGLQSTLLTANGIPRSA
jgi:hypothetical protein